MRIVEIDGKQFRLRLSPDGYQTPYVLKQLKNSAGGFGNRTYWATVWAAWHKSPDPNTKIGRRAIEAFGWTWSRDPNNFGWVRTGEPE
jgi:hypothetical protein